MGRLAVALGPLALTPLLVELLAGGLLDLGGGEKDLVWVLPWGLWAGVFAVASLGLGRRGLSLARASLVAAALGLGAVLGTAALLAALGLLGLRG